MPILICATRAGVKMKFRVLLVAAAAASTFIVGANAADSQLTVYDWTGFNQKNLIPGYISKYGDRPAYQFYGDDGDALKKLSSGLQADIAHPCSQIVAGYRAAGVIQPWDTSKIPNFQDISKRYLHSRVIQDHGQVWYIPTDVGFTAMLYNADEVPSADVSSLNVFVNPKYKGKISLPDASDDAWALALLATGVGDWSNVSKVEFDRAADWLRRANKNGPSYWSNPGDLAQLMKSGRVTVAWAWSDTAAVLRGEQTKFVFLRGPERPATAWYCGWVKLKAAKGDPDRAYDFVNELLGPTGAQGYFEDFGYTSANEKSAETVLSKEPLAQDNDPIHGHILVQTPLDPVLRRRMIDRFRKIRTGT